MNLIKTMGILVFGIPTRKERMKILKRKKVYIKLKKLKMKAEKKSFLNRFINSLNKKMKFKANFIYSIN